MARAEPELRPLRIACRIRSSLPVPDHQKYSRARSFVLVHYLVSEIYLWHISPKPVSGQGTGKSTAGSGDTGRLRNANMPASSYAMVSRVVATRRSMAESETFMATACNE